MPWTRLPRKKPKRDSKFRSGLEGITAEWLRSRGISFEYETRKIKYTKPESEHTYTPDFILPNGIIIETKGRFVAADRAKHLLVKEQHPEYDIRFVFSRSSEPLYRGSPTTYAKWCDKYGFKYSDRTIPTEWVEEKDTCSRPTKTSRRRTSS